jgi:hypothetical protein
MARSRGLGDVYKRQLVHSVRITRLVKLLTSLVVRLTD